MTRVRRGPYDGQAPKDGGPEEVGESDAGSPGPPERPPHEGHGGRLDTARRMAEDARVRVEETMRTLEEARPRSPAVDVGFSLYERDRAVLGPLLSGALAFRLFLWAVPFALLCLAISGIIAGSEGSDDVSDALGFTGTLADAISESGSQSSIGKWSALVIGVGGTAWAGISVTRALRALHAFIWGVRRPRGHLPLGSLLVLAVVLATISVSGLATLARRDSPSAGLIVTLLAFFGFFAIWLAASWLLPHGQATLRDLAPGAALLAVGIQILHLVTVYFLVDHAERAQSVYGAIGASVVILGWLFIVARGIVTAAVLNVSLWERRTGQRTRRMRPDGIG
jgi:uncharacterized BrkB/YihY/UPF0761 family membrane protein